MEGPITIVITHITPAIEEALTVLLKRFGPSDATITAPATPTGVTEADGPKLDDVWLTDAVIYQAADELGLTRNMATRGVGGISQCAWRLQHYRNSSESHDRVPALASELGDARMATHVINAADFVSLVRMPHVRTSIREFWPTYGPKAEEASIQIAEHLATKYA